MLLGKVRNSERKICWKLLGMMYFEETNFRLAAIYDKTYTALRFSEVAVAVLWLKMPRRGGLFT